MNSILFDWSKFCTSWISLLWGCRREGGGGQIWSMAGWFQRPKLQLHRCSVANSAGGVLVVLVVLVGQLRLGLRLRRLGQLWQLRLVVLLGVTDCSDTSRTPGPGPRAGKRWKKSDLWRIGNLVKPGHFKKFLHLLTDRYRSATSGHHLHIEQVQQTATCIFGFSWNRASGNALKKTRSNRIKHTNHIKPLKVGTGTEPARNRHGTGSEPAPQTVSFTGVADFVLQHPTEITQFESWAHFYMFLLLIFADFCQNFPIYQIFDTFVLLTFLLSFFIPLWSALWVPMAQKRPLEMDSDASDKEAVEMQQLLPDPKLCPKRLRGMKRSLVQKVNEVRLGMCRSLMVEWWLNSLNL